MLLPELFYTPIDKSSSVRNDDPDVLAPKSDMGLLLNGGTENNSCALMEPLTCCADIPLFVYLNSLFFPSNSLFADFQFPVLSSEIPCYFGTGNRHLTI